MLWELRYTASGSENAKRSHLACSHALQSIRAKGQTLTVAILELFCNLRDRQFSVDGSFLQAVILAFDVLFSYLYVSWPIRWLSRFVLLTEPNWWSKPLVMQELQRIVWLIGPV